MHGKNITFVVGAGAVKNSWGPVIRAINNTMNIETDGDGANFIFARLIYLLKFYNKVATSGKHKEVLNETKSNISLLKKNIASELIIAQSNGEIRPQDSFKEIISKFMTSNKDKACLITTNWDEIIDKEINKLYRSGNLESNGKIKSFHIHGSIKSPDELYLPSESTPEYYREWSEELKFGKNHSDFMNLLRHTNKTVLYGISLNPLDAELNQTLGAGWISPNIEEIIIINPNHEIVAKRVKLLLMEEFPAKIIAYNPTDLSKKIEYN